MIPQTKSVWRFSSLSCSLSLSLSLSPLSFAITLILLHSLSHYLLPLSLALSLISLSFQFSHLSLSPTIFSLLSLFPTPLSLATCCSVIPQAERGSCWYRIVWEVCEEWGLLCLFSFLLSCVASLHHVLLWWDYTIWPAATHNKQQVRRLSPYYIMHHNACVMSGFCLISYRLYGLCHDAFSFSYGINGE